MTKLPITVVLLDLGDTLVRIRPDLRNDSIRHIAAARGRAIKRKRDLDQAQLEFRNACNAEWAIREPEIREVRTASQERDYWPIYFDAVLGRLEAEDQRGELSHLLARRQTDAQSFECFSDVVETLDQLQAEHFELGIISNAFPSARKIMNHLKLLPRFKYLILSNEVPYLKPEPEIYLHAAEYAHVDPEHAVFVDDRPGFVAGAQAVDMKAVLLDRAGQYGRNVWPGLKIRRLPSLLQIIERAPGRRRAEVVSPRKTSRLNLPVLHFHASFIQAFVRLTPAVAGVPADAPYI